MSTYLRDVEQNTAKTVGELFAESSNVLYMSVMISVLIVPSILNQYNPIWSHRLAIMSERQEHLVCRDLRILGFLYFLND